MRDAGIGRVLVASLHQGIADILPTRLSFYENWLSTGGLREGTIGLAPLYAVLSFLRQEGDAYQMISALRDQGRPRLAAPPAAAAPGPGARAQQLPGKSSGLTAPARHGEHQRTC